MSLPENTHTGNCYVIGSDGGFSLKQNFNSIGATSANNLTRRMICLTPYKFYLVCVLNDQNRHC